MVKKRKQGRPNYYPWDRWLLQRSNPFVVTKEQYSCSQRSMIVMIRTQARLRGVKVSVHRVDDEGIRITPLGVRTNVG
jgi:hypothetical protein